MLLRGEATAIVVCIDRPRALFSQFFWDVSQSGASQTVPPYGKLPHCPPIAVGDAKRRAGAIRPATLESTQRYPGLWTPAVEPQMPIEGGIPEKDWTPIQREIMNGWNRLWTRDRQWLQIGKWRLLQQYTRDWVCLAELADWCARRPGDIERDPSRRAQAFSDLKQSIILGEFNKGGHLNVVYLPPQQPHLRHPMKLRLNADRLFAYQGHALQFLLDLCWAPRELCLRWLLARQIVPPPWLVAEPIRLLPAHLLEASKPGAASQPSLLVHPKNAFTPRSMPSTHPQWESPRISNN
jgi:hypothetical protein